MLSMLLSGSDRTHHMSAAARQFLAQIQSDAHNTLEVLPAPLCSKSSARLACPCLHGSKFARAAASVVVNLCMFMHASDPAADLVPMVSVSAHPLLYDSALAEPPGKHTPLRTSRMRMESSHVQDLD
jgi:hypothetical protein